MQEADRRRLIALLSRASHAKTGDAEALASIRAAQGILDRQNTSWEALIVKNGATGSGYFGTVVDDLLRDAEDETVYSYSDWRQPFSWNAGHVHDIRELGLSNLVSLCLKHRRFTHPVELTNLTVYREMLSHPLDIVFDDDSVKELLALAFRIAIRKRPPFEDEFADDTANRVIDLTAELY